MLWGFRKMWNKIVDMVRFNRLIIFVALFVLFIVGINADYKNSSSVITLKSDDSITNELENRKLVERELGPLMLKNEFPVDHVINWDGRAEKIRVLYSFDNEMQAELEKLIKSYSPDYSAVVAMDATTGQILAMSSYEGNAPSKENRALKATFPAASIFKIVTASAAIDKYNLSPEMELGFTGANYTLYKRNLFSENTRSAKWISFREAFAKSINIFFGKMTLKFMKSQDLIDFAEKFYFNKPIAADFTLESGKMNLGSKDEYHVAELASGFNHETSLSPVHGALIAAAVANDGNMPTPYIIDGLFKENGSTLYKPKAIPLTQVVSMNTAHKLRSMMTDTVESGTSRKSFKELTHKKTFAVIEMGGKTGSITGTNPKGKTEWFIGYGRLGPRMISVAAVMVNKQTWKVKPSFIAQKLIRQYFEEQAEMVTSTFPEKRKTASAKIVDN